MNQRSTRDQMLVGAADILGERLAKATMRVAELEAIVLKRDRRMVELNERVAELEKGMEEYACTGTDEPCGCYKLVTKDRARVAELEASIKAAKQAMAYNDHHDAFLMLQAVLAKGREG